MELNCPIPDNNFDKITIAHGGGGKLSNQLIQDVLVRELDNRFLHPMHDGAILQVSGTIAFTTDSYVVQPLFFPGGDIGKLAVCGTVNDLVCCGAMPKYLSLSFILEEGLEISVLRKIVSSIRETAIKAGVYIVTGDTKVVEKGKGDKIFINTAGIGEIMPGMDIGAHQVQPGDKIIINGSIAEHGIAIVSSREGLEFGTTIESDSASLQGLLKALYDAQIPVRMMRDPTRGGLASSLNEIAVSVQKGIILYETEIPIIEEVKGACEILGFDPLYVANEGKILFFVPEEFSFQALQVIKDQEFGHNAAIIGEVTTGKPLVTLKTILGSHRIIDMISGEQLPRIC